MRLAARLRLRPKRERLAVSAAYHQLVEQSREPLFFRELGVPDTLDGRFELLSLHLFLVLNRLKGGGAAAFGQSLFDTFFADMDRSLREMGASDLGVGRRVRSMAEAFYGRVAAYESGLATSEAALAQALARNLYGTVASPEPERLAAMARYVDRQRQALATTPIERLSSGFIPFVPAAHAVERGGAA